MAASVEAICELALGHLGMSDTITDIAADQTAVARAFRRFYDQARDEVLTAFPWTFAKRYWKFVGQAGTGTVEVSLQGGEMRAAFTVVQTPYLGAGDTVTINSVVYTLVTQHNASTWHVTPETVQAAGSTFTITKARISDPTADWAYAYRLPATVLQPLRLVDGNRTPIRSNWPVFWTGEDDTGRLLYCNYDTDVVLEYVTSVTTTTKFPVLFTQALAAKLGMYTAPMLVGADPSPVIGRLAQYYAAFLSEARATDVMRNRPDDDADAELIQAR